MANDEKTVILDYLFGEGDAMNAYQIIRYNESEPWLVIENGSLKATLKKHQHVWKSISEAHIDTERIEQIGKFIDAQYFNFLPDKIKMHWHDDVNEVMMQNDGLYLVICKPDINFRRFKNVFSAFIAQLVEDEWAVEFKVYNAAFTDEFVVKVF